MKGKFTFKTEKATGQFRSFFPDHHYIKIKGKQCGSINEKVPYRIRLMVVKKDINEDDNPNCEWKWISLKKESKTLQEAKDFLNKRFSEILGMYKLYFLDLKQS